MRIVLALASCGALSVLAGCGGGSSSPPSRTPKPRSTSPTHSVNTPGPRAIFFGTSTFGSRVISPTSTFSQPTKIAWVANLKTAPHGENMSLDITRINGPGTFPRLVWSAKFTSLNLPYATGQMTRSQLKSRHVVPGGKFEMSYKIGPKTYAAGVFQISSGGHTGGIGY